MGGNLPDPELPPERSRVWMRRSSSGIVAFLALLGCIGVPGLAAAGGAPCAGTAVAMNGANQARDLVASTVQPGGEPGQAAPTQANTVAEVTLRDGLLTAQWAGTKADVILRKIAEATGLWIEVMPGLADLPFEDSWGHVENIVVYALSYYDVESLVIKVFGSLPHGSCGVRFFYGGLAGARKVVGVRFFIPGQPNILEKDKAEVLRGLELRERERQERLASVSWSGTSLAKALDMVLAAQQGDTRLEEKLSAFLRLRPVATPEEKRLIKVLLADPRFESVQGALGSFLAPAIQARPEPDDTDLVLDAMRKGLLRDGSWYFRAFPEVWNERFIPYVDEGIRSESYWWIWAAGESGAAARAVVPALEDVLNSDQGSIRRAAAESLQAITGKECPVPPSPILQRSLLENIRRGDDPKLSLRERLGIAEDLSEYELRPGERKVVAAAIIDLARKPLGRGAVFGALFNILVSELQEHHEAGDAEVVLDLLSAKLSEAYKVMDYAWDERFVPFIVRDAESAYDRRASFTACGRHRIEACLPALQRGLSGQFEGIASWAIEEIAKK